MSNKNQSSISQFFKKNTENIPPAPQPIKRKLETEEKESVDRTKPPSDLLALEYKFLGPGWVQALQKDLNSPSFKRLKEFLKQEEQKYTIYPPKELIYNWSRSPIDDVRCCIMCVHSRRTSSSLTQHSGQDPYHGPGQAHGMAFSVKHGVRVPPSLQNIYKELKNEYPGFQPPNHGNLERLCLENGILLLNSTLTVRKDTAGSHGNKGWEQFTTRVLQVLADRHKSKGIVFFCWGNWAKKMLEGAKVDKKKHLILSSVHPSPLSASRGFFNTGHFKQADEWIKERYGRGIDWMVQSADRVDKAPIQGEKSDEPIAKKPKTDEKEEEKADVTTSDTQVHTNDAIQDVQNIKSN
ncbi:hypothetical protein E3P81_01424 [Wallemia ichthyophaga]|nr:hypothetical protein E3P97_01425 [Wallemia ichthyophaga]TIB05940.1 hypothetical protein E3P96_00779 [Wallemia ichthyophaga]TIB32144.1 hypothetical protein E3P85_01926 [Wallemia ichthyophaga]TIB47970.1 hypothetical protein E3P82_01423 [Wallemia ichthyophaga]TIB52207.1 hypothetical protein E3P81_01424 [Wallemia ichthyophaga]